MSLEGLANSNRLRREPTSVDEIKGLVEVVERSLKDASVEAISDDLRFTAAYNALLTSSKIALRATGYRTANQAGHGLIGHHLSMYLRRFPAICAPEFPIQLCSW